jgi:tetratricopeptide (TPR) repeat protein
MFYQVKYNAALCAYLGSDFASAESHLLQLVAFGRDTVRISRSYPLYALVLNELGKYDDAEKYLKKYVSSDHVSKDSLLTTIGKEYAADKRPKYKRLKKAKVMSYIVPGLGQMYAGFYGEGITAMACNVIFIGLTGVGIYYKYYITSILYSYTIFSKFYTGNITRVEFLVNKRNYLMQKEYNQRLKKLVMTCWK